MRVMSGPTMFADKKNVKTNEVLNICIQIFCSLSRFLTLKRPFPAIPSPIFQKSNEMDLLLNFMSITCFESYIFKY